MRINRTCKVCGKPFVAIKSTQFFCKRKCFKRDYYLRLKSNEQDEKENPNYPIKKCAFCEKTARLNFDPMENVKKFNAWACPHCHATNELIWEHQNKPNSHQIISNILISIQNTFFTVVSQTQQYKLPIMRLEQGNPNYVVMTCEKLDIVDIQKKNRKKILFS